MNPQIEWWYSDYNEGNLGHYKKYQNKCRIYLDKYHEQKELRKEYFIKKEAKRMNVSTNYLNWVLKKSSIYSSYFYNRWIRRN